MGQSLRTSWGRGELYDLLCLSGLAICMWLIGEQFDLFPRMTAFMLSKGLASIVCLGFLMCFVIGLSSIRKSFLLRREMEGRAEAEEHAQKLARHDPLTGMANRRVLLESIRAAIGMRAAIVHGPATHAVFLVDLDRFKAVNDIYGHETGDAVLCEAATRIEATIPQGATAARLGGDEFAILVRYQSRSELMRLAEQLVKSLSVPLRTGTPAVVVGATIGIALFPEDGVEADALLRCADIAMYRSKREGRGAYRFFEASMDDELRARNRFEADLRAAIADGHVRPHYQPLVNLPAQHITGYEVLARWYHPEQGVLSPDLFIPIAEETGLISDLTDVILKQACVDAQAWPRDLRLAVNISPYLLADKTLADRILAVLAETGFEPHRLEVEITESALTKDIDQARRTLGQLQAAGVSIALDDFGTGYSSLCHLRDINFDRIKIDRSFVQSMGENSESAKIVSAIIGLGRSMGVVTTAEGIENAENSDWLSEQGCTCGQGFLFGRPMPASDVERSLRDRMVIEDEDVEPLRNAAA